MSMGRGLHGRTTILILTALLLAGPVLGNPNGPPWMNDSEAMTLTAEQGCTCHNGGNPSSEVIVLVSSVPRAYALGETYILNISISSVNPNGGFLITDYGAGTFDPDGGENMIWVAGSNMTGVSQSEPGSSWSLPWTAPSTDVGDIAFSMAGNAVNGDLLPLEDDYWNVLSFTINAPGTATVDAEGEAQFRTISVGDYDSLFVADIDPERAALEAERHRQEELAEAYFHYGNLYFWPTLAILVVAGAVQGEFYQRRFGGGPEHLDPSLAVPQGIRRSLIAVGMTLLLGWQWTSGASWGILLLLSMGTLASFWSVWRTIDQARAPAKTGDML